MPHLLDNVIWNALTGPQAGLAIGGPMARRFPPAMAPFAAMPEPTSAHFDALAKLMSANDRIALFTVGEVEPTPAFRVDLRREIVQMLRPAGQPRHKPSRAVPLGDQDADEMLALAQETQPGPFSERTREMGRFVGIRVDGRLVAMAGERLHAPGHTEVSAVCTLPAHRGHGFANELVSMVADAIAERGEMPFLHAFSDNHTAISVYEELGFVVRRVIRLTVLNPTASQAE